jgi:hypothetical protein
MRLMFGRRDPAFILSRSELNEIQVRFEIPHPFGYGLVFVHLDFKRVLRDGRARKEYEDC